MRGRAGWEDWFAGEGAASTRAEAPAESPPILGAVAGAVGCLQALEALKHLTGIGASTRGKVLFWDGATLDFDTVEVRRDPRCPVCG